MPPKKPAADSVDAPVEEEVEAKSGAAAVRKLATHPSTFIMVKEALIELDSRKGVSSKAIQNYIKQKYPSVDLVRLKHFVRRALKKGIETGTLVRPANSSVATGAMGKFRISPKFKLTKSKTENTDPNVQKAPKPAKDAAKKKSPKAGATKKKAVAKAPAKEPAEEPAEEPAKEPAKSKEDTKPPKKSKKDVEAADATKPAQAKKPKAKKAVEKDVKEDSDSTKTKAGKSTKEAKGAKEAKGTKEAKGAKEAKGTKEAKEAKEAKGTKEAKAVKVSKSKAAETISDAPAPRVTGKRGRKAAE